MLSAIAWHRRAAAASSLGLLLVATLALRLAGLTFQLVVFVLAFIVYAAVVSRVPWLRDAAGWMTIGTVDRRSIILGAVFAAGSGVALLVWYVVARPDLADLVRTFVPNWPLWMVARAVSDRILGGQHLVQ